MDTIETFEVGNKIVRIFQDENPTSPRDDDNLGTILYTSSRYVLGDEQVTPEEIREITERKDVVWLPVYAYIHSGTRLRTASFHGLLPQGHAEFDSGMRGIIYADRETILKNFGKKLLTKKLREKTAEILAAEIETYDRYFCGDIYGYTISTKETCDSCGNTEEEVVDSCWGYYGFNYCKAEAKAAAE